MCPLATHVKVYALQFTCVVADKASQLALKVCTYLKYRSIIIGVHLQIINGTNIYLIPYLLFSK